MYGQVDVLHCGVVMRETTLGLCCELGGWLWGALYRRVFELLLRRLRADDGPGNAIGFQGGAVFLRCTRWGAPRNAGEGRSCMSLSEGMYVRQNCPAWHYRIQEPTVMFVL